MKLAQFLVDGGANVEGFLQQLAVFAGFCANLHGLEGSEIIFDIGKQIIATGDKALMFTHNALGHEAVDQALAGEMERIDDGLIFELGSTGVHRLEFIEDFNGIENFVEMVYFV